MQRRILAVSALVAVLVSCGDSPTVPAATVLDGAPPDLLVSTNALATISDLLDDPFVHVLVESVQDRGTVQRLRRMLQQVSLGAAQGNPFIVYQALTAPRNEVDEVAYPDDVLLLATLNIVLDHAQSLLASAEEMEQLQEQEWLETHYQSRDMTRGPTNKQES